MGATGPVSLAARFRFFADTFGASSAPLYAYLAGRAADELEQAGALRSLLRPWEEEPERLLLPLRVLATVHRWVLAGEVPQLARHYPSVGGDERPEGAWAPFRSILLDRAEEIPGELSGVNQHNEVARAAALSVGLLEVARATRLPLKLLEVGASAGLLLRWDRYRERPWWPGLFAGQQPSGSANVVQRLGCDLQPLDPTSPEGALRLRGFVWADLTDHLAMLDDAIALAHRVPAQVDRADGAEWLERVADPEPGAATVVMHSLMTPAADPSNLRAMQAVIERKAQHANAQRPLAYLRFEPPTLAEVTRYMEVRLTTWPGGEERLLATCDPNGRNVQDYGGS